MSDALHDVPIRPAPRALARFLRLARMRGIATPWVVYLRDDLIGDERLRRHLRMHAEQMRVDGLARFLVRYVYWTATYGSRLNPYETEARAAEKRER